MAPINLRSEEAGILTTTARIFLSGIAEADSATARCVGKVARNIEQLCQLTEHEVGYAIGIKTFLLIEEGLLNEGLRFGMTEAEIEAYRRYKFRV
jgi:hypothetical protein